MANAKTSLFPLPQTTVVETVYVQLADGRIVPRSPEELAELGSSEAAPTVIIPSKS
jgi:hypothetical protein